MDENENTTLEIDETPDQKSNLTRKTLIVAGAAVGIIAAGIAIFKKRKGAEDEVEIVDLEDGSYTVKSVPNHKK